MSVVAAYVFVALVLVVCAFQVALAAGAPWGHLAMGGKFPGRFPPVMRVLAVLQCGVLLLLGGIVLIRAGFILEEWRRIGAALIWVVVGLSALSVVMNLATPSKWERIIWGPVSIGLLAASAAVALGL